MTTTQNKKLTTDADGRTVLLTTEEACFEARFALAMRGHPYPGDRMPRRGTQLCLNYIHGM